MHFQLQLHCRVEGDRKDGICGICCAHSLSSMVRFSLIINCSLSQLSSSLVLSSHQPVLGQVAEE